MNACEKAAQDRNYTKIGLGVGLFSDYGSAQRLYARVGYIPDGGGIHYDVNVVGYTQKVVADDNLVLYQYKSLVGQESTYE